VVDFRHETDNIIEKFEISRSVMTILDKINHYWPPKLAKTEQVPLTIMDYLKEGQNFKIKSYLPTHPGNNKSFI
jgi:hypothetical protein